MNKLRLMLLLLLTVVVMFTSCMGCTDHEDINKDNRCDVCFADLKKASDDEGDGNEVADISFSISADEEIVYSGDCVHISLVDGASLGGYASSSVVYTAEASGDSVRASISGSTLTVSGSGSVTVKGSVGGVMSKNSVTVTVLPSNSSVASLISNAISTENAYLGVRHDIGLSSENVGYYNIVGEDGFVRLNDDGTLELIGARSKNSVLKVTGLNGDVVYEGFYNVSSSHLVLAIRQSLVAEGKIASASADIPMSKLAELESLSMLADYPITNKNEYCGFKFLTSLKSLNLRGNPLDDLSFINGLENLEALDLSYAAELDLSDNGITVINNIRSLTSLNEVSINGSLSYFNRQVYDTLHTMVANGQITLEVLEGVKLSAAEIDSFSETVFFSVEECKAHAMNHDGIITPAGEWKHAIISVPAEDYLKYFKIVADNVEVLELYGSPNGYANSTPISSNTDLTINLYNFSLYAPRREFGFAIHVNGAESTTLTINAKRGYNAIKGADWYPVEFPLPGDGIVCDKLEVYSENSASVSVTGGLGYIGAAGVWSNGPQQGSRGGDGANAIVCNEAWFYTYDVRIKGGNGGAGGKGCDGGGELYESVLGYFNGAKGGTGGTGGYALYCPAFHTLDSETGRSFISECLFGGDGGSGGGGGTGKALGSNGDPGDTGNGGKRYLGETGRPTGPIH